MAIKTFTSGEVLTAANTNDYLANSGLVYVTSATVGTGVSSVAVANCFSATYDNYLVTYSGATTATGQCLQVQLGSTVTGYYGTMIYAGYATGIVASVVDNNATNWTHCTGGVNAFTNFQGTIMRPFAAATTSITTVYQDGANAGHKSGWLNNSTSYTGFTLIAAGVTITGGTITVYGYRKA
jgi:hypothetical protein